MNKNEQSTEPVFHIDKPDWRVTPEGEPRGYIQPHTLDELWFHTGTICNLRCPFCFEGSHPGNNRLQPITLEDARPFIEEAVELGVEQFSFTGGEPFVIRDMAAILDFALDHKPCLVLTNATEPLLNRLDQVAPLVEKPFPLRFRVSLDYPDPEQHDAGRGHGNFELSLKVMSELHRLGFKVSIARQSAENENVEAVNRKFIPWFKQAGLPEDTHIVSFTDLALPGSHLDVPHLTENCMTTYKTQEQREQFMCSYSKMVVKKDGRMRVVACTLVDDDEDYDLGGTLSESMRVRVMLRHHRCFGCFAAGTSCSENG
jgi:molybdenum cofactor biosynthesis enzyme MoaA